jgi:hypothetical protein
MSKAPLDIANQEPAVRPGHVEIQGQNDVAYDGRSVGWTVPELFVHRLGDYKLMKIGRLHSGKPPPILCSTVGRSRIRDATTPSASLFISFKTTATEWNGAPGIYDTAVNEKCLVREYRVGHLDTNVARLAAKCCWVEGARLRFSHQGVGPCIPARLLLPAPIQIVPWISNCIYGESETKRHGLASNRCWVERSR